jgi:hypothetical protein
MLAQRRQTERNPPMEFLRRLNKIEQGLDAMDSFE